MNGRKPSRWAASLPIGSRSLPLESDVTVDIRHESPMVGKVIEVSDIAGGPLMPYRGDKVEVLGVILRYGQTVGYQVRLVKKDEILVGTTKDFYVGRCFVEDFQPPTAISAAVRSALEHWNTQRDYWHEDTSGLEALMFDLASVATQAGLACFPWGWEITIPSPMPRDLVHVRCPAFVHDDFWTTAALVTPYRDRRDLLPSSPRVITDHWSRVYVWSYTMAKGMAEQGFRWAKATQDIARRAVASRKILAPLFDTAMERVAQAREEITGEGLDLYPGSISAGFSKVRLKPGSIGLTEPPTDRRPYTVISVSPDAIKDRGYLEQVVLHECIHIAVDSEGGPPHNDLFHAISDRVGLDPEYRD